MKQFKVAIEQDWITNAIKIAFYQIEGTKMFVATPVDLVFEEISEGGLTKGATFTLPFYLAKDFMEAFKEALDGEGIKSEKDSKIEGTLEATKYHLEDLRHLLKLDNVRK